MITSETSSHMAGRLDHPNPKETEENGFTRMIESLKEEVKNSLKEMEEKIDKKIGRNQ